MPESRERAVRQLKAVVIGPAQVAYLAGAIWCAARGEWPCSIFLGLMLLFVSSLRGKVARAVLEARVGLTNAERAMLGPDDPALSDRRLHEELAVAEAIGRTFIWFGVALALTATILLNRQGWHWYSATFLGLLSGALAFALPVFLARRSRGSSSA